MELGSHRQVDYPEPGRSEEGSGAGLSQSVGLPRAREIWRGQWSWALTDRWTTQSPGDLKRAVELGSHRQVDYPEPGRSEEGSGAGLSHQLDYPEPGRSEEGSGAGLSQTGGLPRARERSEEGSGAGLSHQLDYPEPGRSEEGSGAGLSQTGGLPRAREIWRGQWSWALTDRWTTQSPGEIWRGQWSWALTSVGLPRAREIWRGQWSWALTDRWTTQSPGDLKRAVELGSHRQVDYPEPGRSEEGSGAGLSQTGGLPRAREIWRGQWSWALTVCRTTQSPGDLKRAVELGSHSL